jgi:hypothetical protein
MDPTQAFFMSFPTYILGVRRWPVKKNFDPTAEKPSFNTFYIC